MNIPTVTAEQVNLFAQNVAAIAAVFDPKSAATIALLTQAGITLNQMIQAIRTQNEANSQAVWKQVSTDFNATVSAFDRSIGERT